MKLRHNTKDGYTITTVEKFEGVKYTIVDKFDRSDEHISSDVTLERCTEKEKHFADKARKG